VAYVVGHLPGTNEYLHEYSTRHGVPYEAARGGRETMYPEFATRLRTP
jgi:hypothetical protein